MLLPKVFVFALIAILISSIPVLAQNGETQNALIQILELLKKLVELLTQMVSTTPTVPRGAYGYVMIDPTGEGLKGPAGYAGDYASSSDLGTCGKYQVLDGMTVTIKRKDGSYCKEVPVSICRTLQGASHPFYQTNELLPWSQQRDYTISLNLPDGWTWADSKSRNNVFPRDVIVGTSGSFPFSFIIKQGGPTPAHLNCGSTPVPTTKASVSCSRENFWQCKNKSECEAAGAHWCGSADTAYSCTLGECPQATTTTQAVTTTTTTSITTTSSTTSSSTTTTSSGLPDLIVTSNITNNTGYNPYVAYNPAIVYYIKNNGTADAGAFDTYFRVANFVGQSVYYIYKANGLTAGSTIYVALNVSGGLNRTGQILYLANATVDYLNNVSESNENNNRFSKLFMWNMTNPTGMTFIGSWPWVLGWPG